MYVKAPRRSSNGQTLVSSNFINANVTSARFNTFAGAYNILYVPTHQDTTLTGRTLRASMQKGVLGYQRYKNTTYSADYRSYESIGRVFQIINEANGKFYPRFRPLGFGYTGFHDSGCGDPLTALDPTGVGGGAIGLYNRACIANLENRAIAECRVKMARQEINLSESLADFDKTAIMVAQASLKLLKAARAAMRGNFQTAARYLEIRSGRTKYVNATPGLRKPIVVAYKDPTPLNLSDWGKIWLEMKYGWLPLLSDIHNGTNVIKQMLDPVNQPHQMYVVRNLSAELTAPVTVPSVWIKPEITSKADVRVQVKFRYSVDDPFWAFMQQIGLTNPVNILWESLPMSFVLDWILPVGDMLTAFSSHVGLKFISGYRTTLVTGEAMVKGKEMATYGVSSPLMEGSAVAKTQALYLRRQAYSGFPNGMPYFRNPLTSSQKVVTAAALISQTNRYR